MALHFENTPPLVSFSGNPIRYKVHHQGISPSAKKTSPATNRMVFDNVDTVANHYMELTMGGATVIFTLKATPGVDPFELPVGVESVADWTAAVFARLQENSFVISNYLITLGDKLIEFIALQDGEEFDIACNYSDITGITVSSVAAASPDNTADAVFIFIANYVLQIVATEQKPLSTDGFVDFELSEYFSGWLASLVQPRFHTAQVPAAYLVKYTDQLFKFKVGTAVMLDGTMQAIVWDSFRWAITGGLGRESLVTWNQVSAGFWATAANQTRFLTWFTGKKTSRTAPEVLYFFVQSAIYSSLRLKFSAICTDGTSLGPYTVSTFAISGTTSFYLIELQCGYAQIDLEKFTSKPVRSYTVWLENQLNTRISDEFVFDVDETHYEFERIFFYRNSFGVFDSIRTTGKRESNLEYDRETATLSDDVVEDPYNAPVSAIRILETQVFSASTGWVTLTALDLLRDFFLSKEIYEISSKGTFKCIITTKKTKSMLKDGEYNYSVDFEYSRAYSDNAYSN